MKLDLGCGSRKREGFFGVDQFAMPGVDLVLKIGQTAWPWEDASVDEAFSSHFLEHLTALERVHFYNELHRVLKPGAQAVIVVPHWNSNRAYGDPTHQWPPVSEMSFFYLSREWRKVNAPHTDIEWNPAGFHCDFLATWGYALHPLLLTRNPEYQQYALSWFKEAAQDIQISLTKR